MTRWVPLAIVLWWLFAAALLPPVQDEAYYFLWARHLALGYFDHPPMVAFIGATHNLAPYVPQALVPLVSRLGTVAVGALTLFVAIRLFERAGFSRPAALTGAVLLSHGNIMGLVYGFLTTPDTALVCCWVLALHEALAALDGKEKRWLTAGAATGLGLMSKYTMLLMGLVFLWALLKDKRRLARPWPYLGGVVALLFFLPNVAWNAQHDWITFKFQLRHGFSMDRPELGGVALPSAQAPLPGGPELALAKPFLAVEEAAATEEKKPGRFDAELKALNRYVGYYASQIGIWGLFLIAVPLSWRASRRMRAQGPPVGLTPNAKTLFIAATAVPLIVFGLISLGSKVEANWSGMYVFAAAALLAPYASARPRLLAAAAGGHALLLALAMIHARTGILPTRPHQDRLLLETHGYRALAGRLAELKEPVFADTYQTAAMTRFWEPALRVRQWPGITRVSEFLRNPALADLDLAALEREGAFWVVQGGTVPSRLPGFVPTRLSTLRDCVGEALQEMDFAAALDVNRRCRRPVHEWYLIRYERTP